MPHAHHFLERLDRVRRDQVDFALALYRDDEAVRHVLERVSLPADAERVALAIDDPAEGPFVIVTRGGRFVTCLGAGMSPGACPVVPRAQIDALLAKLADKRARLEIAARQMRPGEGEDDLFGRVYSRGSRLTREDFLAISAFESMLGIDTFITMVDLGSEVVQSRPAIARIRKAVGEAARALEAHHQLEWSVAHLAMLSAAAERKHLDELVAVCKRVGHTPSFLCSAQAGQTFFLRGAFLAARLGKGVLASYRGVLAEAHDWLSMFDAALGIGAVGLRHAGAAAEARRMLAAQVSAAQGHPDDIDRLGRALFADWVGGVMDKVEEHTQTAMHHGRRLCVISGASLPAGHRLRFDRNEDVPDDLARTAMLSFDGDVFDERVQSLTLSTLPLAARAAAADFYFPRDVTRAWLGTWSGDETIGRLKRFARPSLKQAPARAPPTPGRNDPCPCGSGKKWKRCCGA